jgi:hypothetical protein
MPRRHALRFHSRRFGRRPAWRPVAQPLPAKRINEDLRLFAVTFTAGFLFISLLIA